MSKKIKISIIIVYYKVREELFSCLTSIKDARTSFAYEVIVVDNDEEKTIEKDLKKKFPWTKYIKSPGNIGFGAGNNLGAKFATGEYIFFLNPDTTVSKNSINTLTTFLDKNPQVGIVAPLLLDKENKPYPFQGTKKLTPVRAIFALSFLNKVFPKNPVSKEYWLMDWDKTSEKEVDVVPGTAFIVRKTVFEKTGNFDENFFMYYEESDLCNRVKNINFKIYILPSATVHHAWGSSTKKSEKNIQKIFSQSQFHYFKKNYGVFSAVIVKFFTEFNKEKMFIVAVCLLGLFLRFYHLKQNFYFDAEVGDNLLDFKNIYIQHTLPLIGPPTSHPWLYFGPLFYWLYFPFFLISKFNPLFYGYLGALFSACIIPLNHFFIKKICNKTIAYISTYIIAISPLFLEFARHARFFSLVPLFVYPFLYFVYKISQREKKYLFWTGLLFGTMLNFHYTPLMLVPFVITVFLLKKIRLSIKQSIVLLSGFILPLSPLIFYDGQHKFSMTKNLFLWIPYRVLGFFGIYHKNTVSTTILKENIISYQNFFSQPFIPTTISYIGDGILLLFLCFIIYRIWIKKYEPKLYNSFIIIVVWGLWGLIAVFLHGSPPEHYFVPILPFPIILGCFIFNDIWQKKLGKIFVLSFLVVITFITLRFYFSQQWFDAYQLDPFNFMERKNVAKFIIKNAKGRKFVLKRIGYNDQFAKNYSQNYIYLLWYYGNEPVEHAKTTYTIIEDQSKFSQIKKTQAKKVIIGNVIILL